METGGAGGGGGATTPVLEGPFYTRLQRLTKSQWERAVADILRLDPAATVLPGLFPPARGTADFDNNERLLFADLAAVLAFERGAETAAALATASTEALANVYAGADAAGFVRVVGRRAFRRPLTTVEEERYQKVFARGETIYGPGFGNGAALVIRALLQSPAFLYRAELGPAGQSLDAHELASKLSFAVNGTTPSDALLDMAAAGGLDTADGLEQAAREMLASERAAAVMLDFHGQLYELDRYGSRATAPLPPATWRELAEVSDRFFDSVFRNGEGLRAILTSRRAFMGTEVGLIYGPESPSQVEQRTLDASRTGFFMQVPFLWLAGGARDADSFARGGIVNRQVLCVTPEPHETPPVPETLPGPADGETNRTQLEKLTAPCGSCHTDVINPVGFAFDNFDVVGRDRSRDSGVSFDTRGTYRVDSVARSFTGAKDLMTILADSEQAHACYARKLMGYALQRDLGEGDRLVLGELTGVSRSKSLKEMIVSLVRSPAFRQRPEVLP